MKIIISKNDNEISAKLQHNENILEFNYVELINELYDGNEVELETIGFSQEEVDKFSELFNEMKTSVNEKSYLKDGDVESQDNLD